MKNQLLLIGILLTTTFSFGQWGNNKVTGNGKVITINRTTSNYNEISCSGPFDYVLFSGTEGKLAIQGEENLLKHIITKVENGKLIIKTEQNVNLRTTRGKTITVHIPFQKIEEVSLLGSGDLYSKDLINADDFEVDLSGSGDIDLNVKANEIESHLTGSGDIKLSGQTTNLELTISGSGDYDCFDLESENTEVSISGSGDVNVVSNTSLKVRVSGSGDVTYKGNPLKEDSKVSGSGSVSKH
ncbi:head GIN domain-containing protein [Bizionia sp. KMM 8389]